MAKRWKGQDGPPPKGKGRGKMPPFGTLKGKGSGKLFPYGRKGNTGSSKSAPTMYKGKGKERPKRWNCGQHGRLSKDCKNVATVYDETNSRHSE